MKRAVLGPALAAALFLVPPAHAEIGTIDTVPAATLLLPYFEVDLSDPNGRTTLISINNTSASAAIAHVTLWTDQAVPTTAFDIYLTGYDVQPINLRDVFNGNLPQTADDGQDPTDTISPQGPFSQDINFPGSFGPCGAPGGIPAPIPVSALRAAHTGQASSLLGGLCGSRNLGDNVARGYITVDSVNQCLSPSTFPSTANYFTTVADFRNILWGDFLYVDPAENLAQGDNLIHIEADANDPLTDGAGDYTFYGRYVSASGADHREPLATTWSAGFLSGRTDLLVWRDSGRSQAAFACNSPPGALPHTEIIAFDWEEGVQLLAGLRPFPAAAQRVTVGGSAFPVPHKLGWAYLNLNATVSGGQFNPFKQSAVLALHRLDPGTFSSGVHAVQLDNASNPNGDIIAP
jgi:hypothetical protein